MPHQVWEDILPKALACIDRLAKQGIRPKWSFGGGTAMMMTYSHRESKDIDIFVPDPQFLGYLNPKLQDDIQEITGCTEYVEQNSVLKLILDVGDIDFVVALPLTKDPFEDWAYAKRKIRRERPLEIVAKKVVYRADNFKIRDVFDLACVLDREPQAVAAEETVFRSKRAVLMASLETMRPTYAEQAKRLIAIRPGFEKLRDTAMDRVLEFYRA